jgi:hypothetical protein
MCRPQLCGAFLRAPHPISRIDKMTASTKQRTDDTAEALRQPSAAPSAALSASLLMTTKRVDISRPPLSLYAD